MCLSVPGRVVAVDAQDELRMGTVDFSGVRKRVCLEAVPAAKPGDYVLVHVGYALTVLDEVAANATLALLHELAAASQPEDTES